LGSEPRIYQVGENNPLKLFFTDREAREGLGASNLSFSQKPPLADGVAVRAEVQWCGRNSLL
jgi:hypothetical protein